MGIARLLVVGLAIIVVLALIVVGVLSLIGSLKSDKQVPAPPGSQRTSQPQTGRPVPSTVWVEVNGKARSPGRPGERHSFTVTRDQAR
jgi:hypothetical protein